MRLQNFNVQYETLNGQLTIGTFAAYSEAHLQMVFHQQLGYYPPIYYIIEQKETVPPVVGTPEYEAYINSGGIQAYNNNIGVV
jgi:hypothetical protein